MSKKTNSNIATIENNLITIKYDKVKVVGEGRRITNAALILEVKAADKAPTASVFVKYPGEENGAIIDYLAPKEKGQVFVDVTEEINFLMRNQSSIEISFVGNLSFSESVDLFVESVPENIMHENNAYVEADAGRAGCGKVNLATGTLRFLHEGNSGIGVVYNGWQEGKDQTYIADISPTSGKSKTFDHYTGLGMKLSVEQFLVRRNGEDDQEVFTYVDGDGNYHEFTEKYYYMTGKKKNYVAKKEVNVNLDGKLTYSKQKKVNGKKETITYEVKVEKRSTSGLILGTDYSEFKGGQFIEQRQEEQIKLEEQVESYKRQLDEYVVVKKDDGSSLATLSEGALTQENFDTFIGKSKNNLLLTKSEAVQYNSLLLQCTEKDAVSQVIDTGKTVEWKNKEYEYKGGEGSDSLFALRDDLRKWRTKLKEITKKINVAVNGEDYQYAEFFQFLKDGKFTKNSTYCMGNLYSAANNSKLLKNIPNQSFQHFKDNVCNLQFELDSITDDLDCYNRSKSDSTTAVKNMERQKYLQQNLRLFQNTFNNKVESAQQKINELDEIINNYLETEQNKLISDRLEMLIALSDYNKTDIVKYYKQYVNQKHELDRLLEQMPTHFIAGNEGVTMGFNQDGRLVCLFDSYENQTAIIYKDGKITRIQDTDNNTTVLKYDDNNRLTKIIAPNGKVTYFEYSNNLLCKIVEDSDETIFAYVGNRLHSVVNQYGQGVRFTYEANGSRVGKIEQITKIVSVVDGSVVRNSSFESKLIAAICYNESYWSTTVTDVNDVHTTYNFDILGKPVTVYDGVYEDRGETTRSVSFEYAEKKKSFSISENITGPNLLGNIGKLEPLPGYGAFQEYGISGNSAVATIRISPDLSFDRLDDLGGSGSVGSGGNIGSGNSVGDNQTDDFETSFEELASTCEIPIDISTLPEGETDFVFSAWALADSAYITSERNLNYGNSEKVYKARNDLYKKKRKFELRAELTYANGKKEKFFASYDWLNTAWQFVALPIERKLNSELVKFVVIADYSYNVGAAEFDCLSLRLGTWTYSEFDKTGKQIYSEDNKSKTHTQYFYNDDDQLVKELLTDREGRTFESTYEYNSNGVLVRSISYNGTVTEHVFDEKGRETKQIVYNLEDPTSKLYTESVRDEKGRVTADIDQSGTYNSAEYTYDHEGTNTIVTDGKGNQTAYGYKDGQLISISGSTDGEESVNKQSLTANMLTKVSNGETEFKFSYDGWGRSTQIDVGDTTYAKIYNHSELESITILANGVYVKTVKDKYGNTIETTRAVASTLVENTSELEQSSDELPMFGTFEKTTYQYDIETKQLVSSKVERYIVDPPKEDVDAEAVKTIEGVDKQIVESYNIIYIYDAKGNVVETVKDGDFALTKKNTYTKDNDMQKTEYAVGKKTLTYEFETDHTPDKRSAKIVLPFGLKQELSHDGLGRTREIALGNNLVKDIFYAKYGDHATDRISSVWHGVNGVRKDNTRYTYDRAGNIETVAENGKLVARYAYDGLNRLVREDNVYLGTFTFQYDHAGNILCKTAYPFTLDETITLSGKSCEYGYAQHGWKDQLASFGKELCEYDSLGNPEIYRGYELAWQGRRLVKFDGVEYTYDADGIRTSKSDGIKQIKFFTDKNQIVAEQIDDNESILCRYYIYGADGIAGFSQDGVEYLFRKNVQGDVTHIYTTDGKLVGQYIYDAWGNYKILLDIDGIATSNPFRYRGYYFDYETGLYYLQTRYYDPETGRFISADSIDYLDPETLGGLNLYAYCGNNPVTAIDPNGTAWWHWVVGALVVAALVALTVVSAGGFAAGMFAIGAAACGIASATMTTTVLAFATVGAGVAYAAYAGYSLFTAVERGISANSFSAGVDTFMDMGAEALGVTVSAGIAGGFGGYISYTQQIGDSSRAGFMSKSERDKQRRDFWISQAKDPTSKFHGNERALQGLAVDGLEISHIYGTYGNNRYYFVLSTNEEHRAFHAIYGYKTFGGPFNRINPNYINWWQFLKSIFGGW